jgi:hypothetical protein
MDDPTIVAICLILLFALTRYTVRTVLGKPGWDERDSAP